MKINKYQILIFIGIILIFLLGISMLCYPYISQYLYEKNSSKLINSYHEITRSYTEEQLQEELEKCYEYNKEMLNNYMVITDPFDPDDFPVTEENYDKLLAFSEIMANIKIPSININLPIYHGTSEEVLEKGVGHLDNTSLPVGGKGAHAVLSAHRGLASARLFTDLNKLKNGDIININVLNKNLYYEVFNIEVVEPHNVETLRALPEEDFITLITCTPYGINTHRLLVHAKRIENIENEKEFEENINRNKFEIKNIIEFVIMLFIIIFILLILRNIKQTKEKQYNLHNFKVDEKIFSRRKHRKHEKKLFERKKGRKGKHSK